MKPKFKRGYRVKILSRKKNKPGAQWENTGVDEEAIIECSSIERGYNCVCYHILIIYYDGSTRSIEWYEEDFLELVCCNEKKGEEILKRRSE